MVEIHGPRLLLRPWRPGDEPALVRHGNDRGVWRSLTDRFPHPCTAPGAAAWIEPVIAQGAPPEAESTERTQAGRDAADEGAG